MARIRQLIWAKLGDEYVMESGMCGYDVEITKTNSFDLIKKENLLISKNLVIRKRKAFDLKRKAFDFLKMQ